MANNCYNVMTLTGADEQLNAFEKFAKGKDAELQINNFIPVPDELLAVDCPNRDPASAEALTKAYGAPCWYQWKLRHWGIKWDVQEVIELKREPGSLQYGFTTPWNSLSQNAMGIISERFPGIRFQLRWEEENMEIKGEMTLRNGIVLT